VIEEDVKLLGITWDVLSRTSDHFEALSNYCEQMIREGKAFADDTDAALMKEEREQKKDSVNRNNSVAKNLQIWEEM
jgi:bifunctional glutamyl/prolyl-tRNA synthetase